MNLEQPGNDVGIALRHVRAMQGFYQQDIGRAIRDVWADSMLNNNKAVVVDGDASTLDACAVGDAHATLVYFFGCDSVLQGTNFFLGYANSDNVLGTLPFNSFTRRQASAMIAGLQNALMLGRNVYHFVGWSSGGCVAYEMLRQLRALEPNARMYVTTFGAPRYSNEGDCRYLTRDNCVRYFNSADPVPMVPPRPFDSPAMLPAVTIIGGLRCANLCHPVGGCEVMEGGVRENVPLPRNTGPLPTVALGVFFYNATRDIVSEHSLSIYRERFEAMQPADVNQVVIQRAVADAEVGQPLRRQDMNRREAAFQDAIVRIGAEQNQPLVHVPPELEFRTMRTGRIWYVIFGTSVICAGPTKKHAKGIARLANAWLRRLQTSVQIDPDAIVAEIQRYLVRGADQAGDFDPPMNIVGDLD